MSQQHLLCIWGIPFWWGNASAGWDRKPRDIFALRSLGERGKKEWFLPEMPDRVLFTPISRNSGKFSTIGRSLKDSMLHSAEDWSRRYSSATQGTLKFSLEPKALCTQFCVQHRKGTSFTERACERTKMRAFFRIASTPPVGPHHSVKPHP